MTTKIIHLLRGAQDGLEVHTNEELEADDIFWIPSPDLEEVLSGKSFAEIQIMLDDHENEKYLPYQAHLIAYVFDEEMDSEQNLPTYRYVECPEKTYARIKAREHYNQEH